MDRRGEITMGLGLQQAKTGSCSRLAPCLTELIRKSPCQGPHTRKQHPVRGDEGTTAEEGSQPESSRDGFPGNAVRGSRCRFPFPSRKPGDRPSVRGPSGSARYFPRRLPQADPRTGRPQKATGRRVFAARTDGRLATEPGRSNRKAVPRRR
jgi:hypothetical protein